MRPSAASSTASSRSRRRSPATGRSRGCSGRAAGDWILNVDDDEVPSPRLLEALPAVDRTRRHHARLDRAPLALSDDRGLPRRGAVEQRVPARLLLADRRFTQFSRRLPPPRRRARPGRLPRRAAMAPRHRPQPGHLPKRQGRGLRARAPGNACERPLAQPRAVRPELVPGAAVTPVPAAERAQIERVLAGAPRADARRAGRARLLSVERDRPRLARAAARRVAPPGPDRGDGRSPRHAGGRAGDGRRRRHERQRPHVALGQGCQADDSARLPLEPRRRRRPRADRAAHGAPCRPRARGDPGRAGARRAPAGARALHTAARARARGRGQRSPARRRSSST